MTIFLNINTSAYFSRRTVEAIIFHRFKNECLPTRCTLRHNHKRKLRISRGFDLTAPLPHPHSSKIHENKPYEFRNDGQCTTRPVLAYRNFRGRFIGRGWSAYIHTRSNQPVYLYARVYTLSLKCEMMYLRRQLPSPPRFPRALHPWSKREDRHRRRRRSFRLIIGLRAKSITPPSPRSFWPGWMGGLSVSQPPLINIYILPRNFHSTKFLFQVLSENA